MKVHQSKNYHVNIRTHLFKGSEPPMAFSVQILDKKHLGSAEKGFREHKLHIRVAQQSVAHNSTDNRSLVCHNPQPYWVSKTCGILIWTSSYNQCFWLENKNKQTNIKAVLYRCLFQVHDALRDIRNTGKPPTFILIMMHMNSIDLWILEIGQSFGEDTLEDI